MTQTRTQARTGPQPEPPSLPASQDRARNTSGGCWRWRWPSHCWRAFPSDRLAGFLTLDETQMLLALRGGMGKAFNVGVDVRVRRYGLIPGGPHATTGR